MTATIVTPTYNERENIAALITAIMELDRGLRVLVVDDNSPDGTADVVRELATRHAGIGLLERPGKLGLGTAYVQGFTRALAEGADVVISMDADLSHDPKYLPDLLNAISEGADVAVGSRYVRGVSCVNWPFRRIALSKAASRYVRTITGMPLKDATAGFIAYRREVLEAIDLPSVRSNGYCFLVEMKYRAWRRGFRVVEVPIVFVERRAGGSKLGKRVIFEAAWKPWALRLQTLTERTVSKPKPSR